MSLFVSLYLDEDVDVFLADLLRGRGFHALTTTEANQKQNKDRQQLEFAISNGMTLFTHNRIDFEDLHKKYLERNKKHHGIIIASHRPARKLLPRLLIILNHTTAEEMNDQLRYI